VGSPTPSEIDALALSIEQLIAQNEEALAEYDELSVADVEASTSSSPSQVDLFGDSSR
jgi:hypothetical protein